MWHFLDHSAVKYITFGILQPQRVGNRGDGDFCDELQLDATMQATDHRILQSPAPTLAMI